MDDDPQKGLGPKTWIPVRCPKAKQCTGAMAEEQQTC